MRRSGRSGDQQRFDLLSAHERSDQGALRRIATELSELLELGLGLDAAWVGTHKTCESA